MKHWFNKLVMMGRIAFKNIRFSPLRACIFFLSLTIMSTLTMMVFSLDHFIESYFTHEIKEIYHAIDFYLTVDENTNLRFFSTRELEQAIDFEQEFDFVAPVFQMKSLMKTNDTYSYVDVIAASRESLNHLTHHTKINDLKAQEMVISQTLSEINHLTVGDQVELMIGDAPISFTIVSIVPEDGLLQKNTIFMNKDDNLHYFLKSMGIHLQPQFTKNIYNRVYFSVKEGASIQEKKAKIEAIDRYDSFVLHDTYHTDSIRDATHRVVSLMYVLLSFVIVAVLFVIQSTYKILLQERKKLVATINSLGGSSYDAFSIILMEWFFYTILATVMGTVLTNGIISIGLQQMESTLQYTIHFIVILLSFIVSITYILWMTWVYYQSIKETSVVTLSHPLEESKLRRPFRTKELLIISLSCLALSYIIPIDTVRWIHLIALIRIILCCFVIYFGSHVFIQFISQWLSKKQRGVFSIYYVKELKHNSIIKQVTSILMLSMGLIMLMVSTNQVIRNEVRVISERFTIDLALVNVIHQQEKVREELEQNEAILRSEPSILLQNIMLVKEGVYLDTMLAVDSHQLGYYLDHDLSDEVIQQLKSKTIPYIVLPDKFHYVYQYHVGDQVTISLSKDFPKEIFVIAGFSSIGYTDLAITNIHQLPQYNTVTTNAFLVNVVGEKSILKEDLIKTYSKQMIVVLDYQETIDQLVQQIHTLTTYFYYLLSIIVFCFIITMVNQMTFVYLQLKRQLSKLMAIGYTKSQLIRGFLMMNGLLVVIVCVSLLMMFPIMTKELPYLLLFFNTYQYFSYSFILGVRGMIVGVLMGIIGLCLLMIQINRQHLIDDLKSF